MVHDDALASKHDADTSSGEGAEKRSHILVKPFAAGLATNLVVTTDHRTYHLALTSTDRTAMAAISWSYPPDQLIALRKRLSRRRRQRRSPRVSM